LSLTFRKNRSENVMECGSRRKSALKKPNVPKVEPQSVEVHYL